MEFSEEARLAFQYSLSWPVSLSLKYRIPAVHTECMGTEGQPPFKAGTGEVHVTKTGFLEDKAV